MFTLSGIAKSYGGRTLFTDVSLTINRDDRLGLVGANGAGKSTLFRLLLGQEEADEGQITRQRNATVGFLPQESAPAGDETVLELALGIDPEGHHLPADGSAIARAKRILKGLAFRETDFDRPARELSGGWIMRGHLARLLVQEPDLLMLDEPTNHLDLETLLWFQDYLRTYPGGIVVISHDREFLNRLVTGILELRSGRLWRYAGNYDDYLAEREARQEQQAAAFANQQREIGRLMDFVNRFRAKASTASRAQAKLRQVERMERVAAPEAAARTVDFAFPQPEASGQRVLTLRGVDFSYPGHPVYQGLDFELTRGERIALVGPNGAGKSTLLKLLGEVVHPQAGAVDPGLRLRTGYFAQHRAEMLDPDRTVLAEALSTQARVTELYVRSLLGCFLFSDDDVFKPVRVLSGGEKSRLALVKLLLDPPNLLLLDEPTTHLDIASIDALVAALSEYTGTLVFVSHDVHFIRCIGEQVVHVNAGRLTRYAGDYDYYLEKTRATSARAGLVAGLEDARPTAPDAAGAGGSGPKGPSQKELRQRAAEARRAVSEQRRKVAGLETVIAALEERQEALANELERPETYATPGRALTLNQELRSLVDDLDRATTDWEAAANRLAELEAGEASAP